MASIPARIFDRNAPLSLSFAFIERQTNLWKRYWGWELVWLVYGLVNTLAVTLIAEQLGRQGNADPEVAQRLVLFLLIGTLVWAYLSAVLDDISLVVQWERWEGTIEHTLMAPVPRVLHLLFGIALFFFDVDFSQADWLAASSVAVVGSVSVAALAVLAGVLPLLYPERGSQMSLMVQASLLLVSGVYYEVEVLPAWLRIFSHISPATYFLDGVRGAIIDGDSLRDVLPTLGALAAFAVGLVPASVAVFAWAEKYAKRTGKLKRQG
jgi:ABC-2 type transport system permease protein